MKLRCEVVVAHLLPAIRSIITKELIDTYGLTQKKVAELLRITQPAVSQYMRESRGAKVRMVEKNRKIMEMIGNLVPEIADERHTPAQLHSLFCDICKSAMKEEFIQKLDSKYHEYAHANACPVEAS